ncbi:hypothetical protein MTO96_020386 [Rhipicephalus appendiculatus]
MPLSTLTGRLPLARCCDVTLIANCEGGGLYGWASARVLSWTQWEALPDSGGTVSNETQHLLRDDRMPTSNRSGQAVSDRHSCEKEPFRSSPLPIPALLRRAPPRRAAVSGIGQRGRFKRALSDMGPTVRVVVDEPP